MNDLADQKNLLGKVHSFESMATLDGPGVRSVVFMQGCPLNCVYCQNVDCTSANGGQECTVNEIVSKLLKYKPYWGTGETEGGVTFSGGEPLLQWSFILDAATLLKQSAVNVCIDTSLYTSKQVIDQLLPVTGFWMVSLKHLDDNTHKELTGHSNKLILDNISYLDTKLAGRKQLRVRVVIIPTYTDSEEYAKRIANFCTSLNSLSEVELLTYHKLGKYKWEQSFGKYSFDEIPEAKAEDTEKFAIVLRKYGINVKY